MAEQINNLINENPMIFVCTIAAVRIIILALLIIASLKKARKEEEYTKGKRKFGGNHF